MRLRAVAELVPAGAAVADVACGDGQLTAHLRAAGHTVVPTELPGPAARAAERVEGVRVGDGLSVLEPGEVEVVVIAGLGGGTMRRLIENAPGVVAGCERLVLQPMGPIKPLLELLDGGFEVLERREAVDRGRPYTVLAVRSRNR